MQARSDSGGPGRLTKRAGSVKQFSAVHQDAVDNKALLAKSRKIATPVFAIGEIFGQEHGQRLCKK
jgi:hypothetical protein